MSDNRHFVIFCYNGHGTVPIAGTFTGDPAWGPMGNEERIADMVCKAMKWPEAMLNGIVVVSSDDDDNPQWPVVIADDLAWGFNSDVMDPMPRVWFPASEGLKR